MKTNDKMKVAVLSLCALSGVIDLVQGDLGSAGVTIGLTAVLSAEFAERLRKEKEKK